MLTRQTTTPAQRRPGSTSRTVRVDLGPIRSACVALERRVAELAGLADSLRALEQRIRRLEARS